MRDVYSKASSVVIWLGAGNGELNAKASFSLANDMAKRFSDSTESEDFDWKYKRRGDIFRDNRHAPYIGDGHAIYQATFPVLEANWFSGTGVVQEAFNVKRITVRCGQHNIAWSLILRVIRCIKAALLSRHANTEAQLPAT